MKFAAATAGMYDAICPVAPTGASGYIETLSGNVVWFAIVMFGVVPVLSIVAMLIGRAIHNPRLSQWGVTGLLVAFVAVILFLTVPGIISSMLGSGCA
jgi:bacteriorhodopsin